MSVFFRHKNGQVPVLSKKSLIPFIIGHIWAMKNNTGKQEGKKMAKKIRAKETRSKKAVKEINSLNRVVANMNTGTITHSSPKDYNRRKAKADLYRSVSEGAF